MGIFTKLFAGLKKTKEHLASKFDNLFKKEINEDFYEELEEILYTSDVGVSATEKILDEMRTRIKKNHIKTAHLAKDTLKEIVAEILSVDKEEFEYPLILTIVGVNGVGKTTTIGKLAKFFTSQKKSVMLVAGDTFRAGATIQLNEWGKRNGVRVVAQGEGSDPGAVVFDGISSAKAKKIDVLIIDTAGRLHNKTNLMEELKKINRIKEREWEDAMQLNLLVLDATTGQNAVSQVEAFQEFIGIDGIVLTKLDGSAKGGVVLAIAQENELPIYFVGVGEKIDDLELFEPSIFAKGLIGEDIEE